MRATRACRNEEQLRAMALSRPGCCAYRNCKQMKCDLNRWWSTTEIVESGN
ncbi:hypothetical protein JCGZ_25474 [Jatropha curcas]|uniref:Uncharacterized protein n=1 Tax=Jatropha curcas TaxID=180498 RepID=A0A067LGR1_JATCU|nr:hypothetical protein JCGZ_25474 [Jatropha curcas]